MADVPRPRRKRMARWKRLTLGIVLVFVGLAGLVLPVIQGTLTLAIAALLLSPDFPPARRLIVRSFRRWPKVRRKVPRRFRDLAKRDPSHGE